MPCYAVLMDDVKADRRLAIPPPVERVYVPDRDAMLAALRVVLRLPQLRKDWQEEED